MTRTHERDIEAVEQRCCGDAWGTELPLASQCGCNQQQIPLLYDTLVGIRTLMRETNRHLEYLVIVADELKELKDEQMNALRSCDCCHLHGTSECRHHDETRSAELSPADAGSHDGCPLCGTILENAPGIGPYCPSKGCPVSDGADLFREDKILTDHLRRVLFNRMPPKAESAAAQREGGLCTLCNDGVWKGETHFERSEKHTKASP